MPCWSCADRKGEFELQIIKKNQTDISSRGGYGKNLGLFRQLIQDSVRTPSQFDREFISPINYSCSSQSAIS